MQYPLKKVNGKTKQTNKQTNTTKQNKNTQKKIVTPEIFQAAENFKLDGAQIFIKIAIKTATDKIHSYKWCNYLVLGKADLNNVVGLSVGIKNLQMMKRNMFTWGVVLSGYLRPGGHSHMEVFGMCGQDPKVGVFQWQTK